jgi:hypothetical protein
MKTLNSNGTEVVQPPNLSKMLHHVRARSEKTPPPGSKQKRKGLFSKSRDTREDRGERQMKTSHNSQTFPHGQ